MNFLKIISVALGLSFGYPNTSFAMCKQQKIHWALAGQAKHRFNNHQAEQKRILKAISPTELSDSRSSKINDKRGPRAQKARKAFS